MKEVNKKYYIKLTALTPLCVGAGNEEEWVKCADYVIHNNKVYVLNLRKVAEEGIDLNRLSDLFLRSDQEGIVNILSGKLDDVSSYIFELPYSTDNNIKAFERSSLHNLPVVAGSSLKGAIRSILFNHLRNDEEKNEDVFGKMKDGTDFMRFIKVGDIEMPTTKLFNTKIFNLHKSNEEWCGGWKHALMNGTDNKFKSGGFNTLYESIEPEEFGIGTLMLSSSNLDSVLLKATAAAHADKKSKILKDGLPKLFAIINNFTRNYLQKERDFFERYPADRTDEVIDCIDYLLESIPQDNSSCLLKMSAGVGFHAITGDWQYADYSDTGVHDSGRNVGKQKYKSRKIAETPEGLSLMGFVTLSEVTEDDYNEYRQSIDSRFHTQMQTILNKKAETEAQAKAAEQDRLEKEKLYQDLITSALEAESAGDYNLAIVKANEATSQFPNRAEATGIITRCQAKAAEKAVVELRAKEEAQAQVAREQKVAGGIGALLNEKYEQGDKIGQFKVTDFKMCFSKVAQWAKAAKIATLPDNQKIELKETLKRLLAEPTKKEVRDIKNRKSLIWKNIETWLSIEEANELFNS